MGCGGAQGVARKDKKILFSLLYLLLVASCKIGQFPCCHLDNLFVFEEIIEDRYIIYQSIQIVEDIVI